ncbi:MAG: exodeoxyribonuclease I [Cellvibrionales bacterium]|nr:exodeoxyribonuclease I [Cellvibrionales bacterium]
MPETLYWHDYETFGAHPATTRPSQFAGLRTDLDLQPLGEPLVLYSQPVADLLPAIDACLLTGISPQVAQRKGIPEPEFIRRINAEFSRPQTCGVGYNSLRFDDEVTRYTLYRNFLDPYAREWQNGCSRWDLIDMLRLAHALRPDGLTWPEHEPGVPSFTLEDLSTANGLEHDSAHDALSDVTATLHLARRLKQAQPKLYDYCWQLRDKRKVRTLIQQAGNKPLLHISAKIPARRGCATLVLVVAPHPRNQNAVLAVDLCADIRPLLELPADQLSERLFTPHAELSPDQPPVPLKGIHLNRCPILLTPAALDTVSPERLQIDRPTAERNRQALLKTDLAPKVRAAFDRDYAPTANAEAALYAGFIPDADRPLANAVAAADESELRTRDYPFTDPRLHTLLLNYRARHHPQSLSEPDREKWHNQVARRLQDGTPDSPKLADYEKDLAARLAAQPPPAEQQTLQDLQEWASTLRTRFLADTAPPPPE